MNYQLLFYILVPLVWYTDNPIVQTVLFQING